MTTDPTRDKPQTLADMIGCVVEWRREGWPDAPTANPIWPADARFRAYFRRIESADDAVFAILVVQGSRYPYGSSQINYDHCKLLCEQFPSLKPVDSSKLDGRWSMNKADYTAMRMIFGGGW